MAYGPLVPYSIFPVTADRIFSYIYVGAGSGPKQENLLGVEASLGGDSIWRLFFQMPVIVPSGTLKLLLSSRANATTGVAKVNPKWKAYGASVDPSGLTVVAEGASTVTWASGDNDKMLQTKIVLDATTLPVGGDNLVIDLTFETSGFTLAQISAWWASLIYE
jgi:hypothetical protein